MRKKCLNILEGDDLFTGIVEALGSVGRVGSRLEIIWPGEIPFMNLGDSIAVNGACLTVVELTEDGFGADVVDETMRRTNLRDLKLGDPVNLERPRAIGDRLDGHLVQGHVDWVGVVTKAGPEFHVSIPEEFAKYIVPKGSITVDGVSLTIVDTTNDSFSVAIIPHTYEVTTLGVRKQGDHVNLEFDVLAKYVERLLQYRSS